MEKKKQIPNTLMSSWQKRDIKEFIQALELPEEIYETLSIFFSFRQNYHM